jgi:peroxiredoxin Q/BCP
MRNQSISAGVKRRTMLVAVSVLSALITLVAVASMAGATVPKVGEKAPDFALKGLDDSSVKLSLLLKKGPVVLVVLRGYPGYQCPFCTVQVGSLIGSAAKFDQRKAKVVLVYPGPSDGLKQHAGEFVTGKTMPRNFHLVLDPDYALLKKYDLRWDAPGETSHPSTFVIDRKGKVVFAKVSQEHGGRAQPDDILKALDGMKMEGKMKDEKMAGEKTEK